MDKIVNSCCICGTGGLVCPKCSRTYFGYNVIDTKENKLIEMVNAIYPLPFYYEFDKDFDIVNINTSIEKFCKYMRNLFIQALKDKKKLYKVYTCKGRYFNPLLYLLLSDEESYSYVKYVLNVNKKVKGRNNFYVSDYSILNIDKIHKILYYYLAEGEYPYLENLLSQISGCKIQTHDEKRFFSKCMFCEDGNFFCVNCCIKLFWKGPTEIVEDLLRGFSLNPIRYDLNQILKDKGKYYISIINERYTELIFYHNQKIENPTYIELKFNFSHKSSMIIMPFIYEMFMPEYVENTISNFLISSEHEKYTNPLLYLLLNINEDRKSEIINAHEKISNTHSLKPSNETVVEIKQIREILKNYNIPFIQNLLGLSSPVNFNIINNLSYSEEKDNYLTKLIMFDDNLFPTFEERFNNFKYFIKDNEITKKIIFDLLKTIPDNNEELNKILLDLSFINELAGYNNFMTYVIKNDNVELYKQLNIEGHRFIHLMYTYKARKIIDYTIS